MRQIRDLQQEVLQLRQDAERREREAEEREKKMQEMLLQQQQQIAGLLQREADRERGLPVVASQALFQFRAGPDQLM